MNRAERRRHRQPKKKVRIRTFTGEVTPRDLACPDCDSDLEIRELEPGVFHGTMRHDETCPWYQELKRDLA